MNRDDVQRIFEKAYDAGDRSLTVMARHQGGCYDCGGGPRFSCAGAGGLYGDAQPTEKQKADGCNLWRCDACRVKHNQEVHGVEATEKFCSGCKKSLGTSAAYSSPAGAPWCGRCPRWWSG